MNWYKYEKIIYYSFTVGWFYSMSSLVGLINAERFFFVYSFLNNCTVLSNYSYLMIICKQLYLLESINTNNLPTVA